MSVVPPAIKRALASSTGWRVSSPLRKSGCFVLTYHRVGPASDPFPHLDIDLFREQMLWIRQHCEPVAPAAVRAAALRPSRRRPPVVVSFDDAYVDLYEYVYPVLKQLGIPAACFVPTDYVDRGVPFWWDVLHRAVDATTRRDVHLPWDRSMMFDLDDGGRATFLRACKVQIKRLPDDEKDATMAALLTELDVEADAVARQPSTMTWAQIRAAMDVITFGGHTHTHAIMPVLTEHRLQLEVDTCRTRLEQETGVTPRLFAYPSGAFTESVKAAVARGGFEVAFSTLEGVNGTATDWLEVRRVHAPRSVADMAWLLSGVSLEMAAPRGAASA